MKFKKCGPKHEASYLFEVDKNWMRSGNDAYMDADEVMELQDIKVGEITRAKT